MLAWGTGSDARAGSTRGAATLGRRLREGSAPVFLLEALLSEPLRLWTGYGRVRWNGAAWSGAGELVSISGASQNTEGRLTPMVVSLQGLGANIVAAAVAEPVQGRPGTVYLGAFADGRVQAATPLFAGHLSTIRTVDDGATVEISAAVEPVNLDVARHVGTRLTDADQQARFPGDRFFDQIPRMQDRVLVWD